MAKSLTLRTSAKTEPHSSDHRTACLPVSHCPPVYLRFRKYSLISQPLDQEAQHCLCDFGGGNPVFAKHQDKCKVGLGPTVEVALTLLQPVREPDHPRAISLCSRSRPGPNHPHPAPALIGGIFHSLLAQHSHGLPSLFCGPPLSHSAPKPEPNFSSLAHCLFLSALLVTKLSGCIPRPPPVSHKAR